MAKVKKKTKAELLQEAVAEAVGAGEELHLESVDFSDPNRPKTCLEVDFPILPINHVAAIEGNAGKPIYQMSKWWARRRSSVFRSMLIAAATKAPDDPAEAAKTVWDAYYGNHQKNEAFQNLKVADIFMGGGTTIVEGSRLGMEMYGNDLNPVAWLVVKNELAQVDPEEVQTLLDEIEAEVKPQIIPFYACDCPRGHKGRWTHKPTGKVMGIEFDPLLLMPEQRTDYEYEGPEVIYTFWAKHGPCQATECNHRTPIMTSPVVALKTLTVKAWPNKECNSCGEMFDIEQKEARMAPAATQVITETEPSFAIMDEAGRYICPHCGQEHQDQKAANEGQSSSLGKAKNKKIDFTLLVHPDWLKGSPGMDDSGTPYGGSVTDDSESTSRWLTARSSTLKLIEVRGKLPKQIKCPDDDTIIHTDTANVPKRGHFECTACGRLSKVSEALEAFGRSSPTTPYVHQGYCPECHANKECYGGRFFDMADLNSTTAATREWESLKETALAEFWPRTPVMGGLETSSRTPLHKYNYNTWAEFFNERQLLSHTQILKAISDAKARGCCDVVQESVLGSFQQFLRNQCMFSFWHIKLDKLAPFLSNNNFHPRSTVIEVGTFAPMGYGPWLSTVKPLLKGVEWKQNPWELVAVANLEDAVAEMCGTSKSVKAYPKDSPASSATISCGTSTDLDLVPDKSVDLVVTDPPFGDIMQYSELSAYFYCWMRLALRERYPTIFDSEQPPTALEAVENEYRHESSSPGFYTKALTACWRESNRILKDGGILTFTFHHDKDGPWISVLESLFDAGFYLEAAFPIRSDETKGEGSKPGTFGAQKVEFDIIHVCRKQLAEPELISWARLRRQIMRDVRQLQEIIEQHQTEGLGEADLQVIRRGKALEYFSRHYGKVYIEKGREDEFTVKEALVGINQLLDDESDKTTEAPPVLAEPYTRQFLRLFADKTSLERDQIQKYLRGTGVSPSEFIERGWCSETKKIFTVTSPLEWAQSWKGVNRKSMSRDFDQAYFLVGASYEDSGIRISDTLKSGSFIPHPAIGDLLDWFARHGYDQTMKDAASRARQIYKRWENENTKEVHKQATLFDMEEDE